MNYITISGWGQIHDSLKYLVPEDATSATHIKYSECRNYDKLSAKLMKEQPQCDILIGWSLGGQIACRLVADKILQPKLLILLAAPFQFVADTKVPSGMQSLVFQGFRTGFAMLPRQTMTKFGLLIAKSDEKVKEIVEKLEIDKSNQENWLSWLDEIGKFSCNNLDFSEFPRTLIIHGDSDNIVNVAQAELFAEKIINFNVEIFEFTGHAPHFHDLERVRNLIKREVSEL